MELQHESFESEKLAAKAHNVFADLYHIRNAALVIEVGISVFMFWLYNRAARWHRKAAEEHERKANILKGTYSEENSV